MERDEIIKDVTLTERLLTDVKARFVVSNDPT